MLTDKQKAQAAARQKRFRRRQQDTRRCEQIEKGLPPMPAIPSMPGTPRWRAAIEAAQAIVIVVLDEMEYYFEDRSEYMAGKLAGRPAQRPTGRGQGCAQEDRPDLLLTSAKQAATGKTTTRTTGENNQRKEDAKDNHITGDVHIQCIESCTY